MHLLSAALLTSLTVCPFVSGQKVATSLFLFVFFDYSPKPLLYMNPVGFELGDCVFLRALIAPPARALGVNRGGGMARLGRRRESG